MKTNKKVSELVSQMFENCQQYKLFSNGDLEWDEEKTLTNSKNCAKIAEDFAIGFYDWMMNNSKVYESKENTKQLLEAYKEKKIVKIEM